MAHLKTLLILPRLTWGASTTCTRTSLGSTWTSWSGRRWTLTDFDFDFQVREETGGHYRNTLLGLLPPHGRTRWVKHLQKNDHKASNSQQKHKIRTKMFASSDQHNFLHFVFWPAASVSPQSPLPWIDIYSGSPTHLFGEFYVSWGIWPGLKTYMKMTRCTTR